MRPTCELLSPAGSFDIAKAVIDAGADAVYLAGDLFGARAYAGNLSREELFAILDYAHVRGTSIHLTVNTLLKNREIEGQLYDFILPLYEHGLDAVIVQDFGVLSFLHRYFPQLSLHASTQMSVADVAGALFLQKQGVSRVVTARELSLKEVAQIAALPGLEVETFIHGALCYSYSGQCLMSSMIGGRSGNRGRCAQPCRLPYRVMAVPDESGTAASGQKKGRRSSKDTAFETDITKNACYPLSPKDLCAINLLPELIGAGIHSFKIEGRMKQVEYAAGVTAMYRKYIDAYYADPQNFHVAVPDYEHLMRLGNRSGFTEGYYHTKGSSSMMALYDSSHTSKKVDKKPVSQVRKAPVDLYFNAMRGEPVVLTAIAGDAGVSLSGVEAAPASSRPTTEQDIKKQLTKLGDTPFVARSVDLSVDEGLFLPLSQINQLRRQVLSGLEEQIRGAYYRDCRQLQGPDKSAEAGSCLHGTDPFGTG